MLSQSPTDEESKFNPENAGNVAYVDSAEKDYELEDIGHNRNHTATFQSNSSDNPFFIRDLRYSREEEAKVIRILDIHLFPWILLTTFVLNMDRTNNSNAISDNLPSDLGFNIDVVNIATAIYSVIFSIFTLTGAVIAKLAGPSRCKPISLFFDVHALLTRFFVHIYVGIPFLMFSWGLVTASHALITNKAGYLTGNVYIS